MALPQQYAFLNSYLAKIEGNDESPDQKPLQDENDFYDVVDPDQPKEDDGGYQITPLEQEDEDNQSSDDMGNANDNDDESSFAGGLPIVGGNSGNLGKSIAAQESQGKYSATNKHSSATGKYQFLWSAWGDSIKKVTGVKDREEFLKSPQAQEKYYAFYEKHFLMPQVEKLRQYNTSGLTDQQLAKLVHFRGATGARKYLQGKMADQPEKYNTPISKYIAQHAMGGTVGVAVGAGAQHIGLNNASFDSMYFPMDGVNEFRGLDDGSSVYLEDEKGKKKVLKGKYHKTKMTGNVFEKRIK